MQMAQCFNMVLEDPTQLPELIIRDITYLLPKDHNRIDPAKYTSISYLASLCTKQRNLSRACTDYNKVYDSIPQL